MNYLDFLKNHESFDKYILFLLALTDDQGEPYFSVTDVADMTAISRQNIYNILKRNRGVVDEYFNSLGLIIKKTK